MAQLVPTLVVSITIASLVLAAPVGGASSPIGHSGALLIVTDFRDQVVPANDFITPDPGSHYSCVQVKVDNAQGTEEITCNVMFFSLKDSEGNTYDAVPWPALEPDLPTTDLEAGDIVKGWLTFEVPNGVSPEGLRIRYESFDAKSGWILVNDRRESATPTKATTKSTKPQEDTPNTPTSSQLEDSQSGNVSSSAGDAFVEGFKEGMTTPLRMVGLFRKGEPIPDEAYPADQRAFHRKRAEYFEAYRQEDNEIKKSRVYNEANDWTRQMAESHSWVFSSWVGTIQRISTNQGGSMATLTIVADAAGQKIQYKTAPGGGIESGALVYDQVAELVEGEHVMFSFKFRPGNRGVSEQSLTERGSLSEPEFSVEFIEIKRLGDQD